MDNTDEENELLGFIHLAAATANVVRYLERSEKHQKDRERKTARQRRHEEATENNGDHIEQRLRELAAFERRYKKT